MGLLCHSTTTCWVGGGRKGGTEEEEKEAGLKEFALCLWRQENYGFGIAGKWVPGRKLAE
jgi:hypothetical protein